MLTAELGSALVAAETALTAQEAARAKAKQFVDDAEQALSEFLCTVAIESCEAGLLLETFDVELTAALDSVVERARESLELQEAAKSRARTCMRQSEQASAVQGWERAIDLLDEGLAKAAAARDEELHAQVQGLLVR